MLSKDKKAKPLWLVILAAVVVISAMSATLLAFAILFPSDWLPADESNHPRQRVLLGFSLAIGMLWGLWSLVFFIYWKQGYYPMQVRAAGPLLVVSATVGFLAMLVCTGFLATLLEILDWWVYLRWPGWIVMLIFWGFWTACLFLYWEQGDQIVKMGRVVRLLIVGSCLELFIAIPVHALVYNRFRHDGNGNQEQCFCVRGSYTGLVFGLAVFVWAFGPGVVLLFLREKNRRQELLERLCYRCGTEMVGSPGLERCPKCG